jgi:hypothetical protein
MKRSILAAALSVAAMAWGGTARADSAVETVVVTGSRMPEDAEYGPHVTLAQRADHLVTRVEVVCDTRDTEKRRDELRQTLRAMIAEARGSKSISLSVGEDILTDFDEKMLDKVISPDSKVDTSYARVVIRTELTQDDTFDAATQRIRDFVARTTKVGRTEILINQQFNLGLVAPERYRAALVAKIAADAKDTAALFGTGYDATIENLQHTIEWYQTGPLDLALFIPYRMTVAPHGAR